jgi:NAD(P)-dependent dehydrogenase (short-subunit alcohol dehydrogenase family)
MELRGRRAVITGGASGIGRGLAEAFLAEGAAEVVIADLDADRVAMVAREIGAVPATVDVGCETELARLVADVERRGPIDLFCSNAGINGPVGGPEVADADWDRIWRINVMAHVWAARALLPAMRARGQGYLLSTASAAGLLTNLGLLPYSVTKHAAVGVAEWLAITHRAEGIRVSCLCPQLVATPMMDAAIAGEPRLERVLAAAGKVLSPAHVAAFTVAAIGREEFLILPHAEVRDHAARRATDNERWLAGMRRLWAASGSSAGSRPPASP